jgi:hypothetical protein
MALVGSVKMVQMSLDARKVRKQLDKVRHQIDK